MTTPPTPATSARMRAVRTTGTGPELAVRRALRARGVGYRVGASLRPDAGRPIRPDVVLPGPRVAVFVDGCFWHGCPVHAREPRTNAAWWAAKLAANRARDEAQTDRLVAAGWRVVRAWEHEDPGEVAAVVLACRSLGPRVAA